MLLKTYSADRSSCFGTPSPRHKHFNVLTTYSSPVDSERLVVKRIIGLEGDIVRTRHPFPQNLVAVPKGQLWVEGDEAFHSLDSNSYGPIPIALVTAKVTHIVFPFTRIGRVLQKESLSRRDALVRRADPARVDLIGL